jgi:NAD(P)-dependent dehydrogenase (short-subunit alcohol dehydrogenase family)
LPETYLITGANRGIGLALTKNLLAQGDRVFAACREPQKAEELKALGTTGLLEIVELAVDSEDSVKKAVKTVGAKTSSLDVLINNAGIMPDPSGGRLESLDLQKCRDAFEVNSLSPVRVTQAFLPLLKQGKNPRVLHMTSGLGSLESGGSRYYAYSPSKAALNMFTRIMASELQPLGITVVCVHPGWVKTDMGGSAAPLLPDDSAAGILQVVKGLTIRQTSSFLDNRGKNVEW